MKLVSLDLLTYFWGQAQNLFCKAGNRQEFNY